MGEEQWELAKLTHKDIMDLGWNAGSSMMSMKSPTYYYWDTDEDVTYSLNFWESDREYLKKWGIQPGTVHLKSDAEGEFGYSGLIHSKAHLAEIMKKNFKLNKKNNMCTGNEEINLEDIIKDYNTNKIQPVKICFTCGRKKITSECINCEEKQKLKQK